MAIAFQTATNGGSTNPGTSHTFAHTTSTGSNRILFVLAFGGNDGDFLTDCTYAGTSATLIDKSQEPGGGHFMYSFYQVAPATGANNVVITMSASKFISGGAHDYTGALQTGVPDAKIEGVGIFTTTLTTVADNCWTVLHANNGAELTAGAGSTDRTNSTISWEIFDSNAVITPAGSTSMTFSGGTEANARTTMFSFAPSLGGDFTPRVIMF